MNNVRRPVGPRCSVCGQTYQPRVMRDGTMSQTCGRPSCVAMHTRRKASNYQSPRPTAPGRSR